MRNLGKTFAIILILIISSVIGGFVVSKLWGWFVVPIFNLNPLTLFQSIGLLVFINYIRAKRDKEVTLDNFWNVLIDNFIFVISMAVFALFIGWIISLLI